jgi:hypothetical protein
VAELAILDGWQERENRALRVNGFVESAHGQSSVTKTFCRAMTVSAKEKQL